MTLAESLGCRSGRRGLAPHLSLGRTLVSLDLSAIGAGRAGAKARASPRLREGSEL